VVAAPVQEVCLHVMTKEGSESEAARHAVPDRGRVEHRGALSLCVCGRGAGRVCVDQ
jgi:hypothetical protein